MQDRDAPKTDVIEAYKAPTLIRGGTVEKVTEGSGNTVFDPADNPTPYTS